MTLTSYSTHALRSLSLAALKAAEVVCSDLVVRAYGLERPLNVEIVINDTEGVLDPVECFNRVSHTCPLIDIRNLSRALHKATSSVTAVLQDAIFADGPSHKGKRLARIVPLNGIAEPMRRAP